MEVLFELLCISEIFESGMVALGIRLGGYQPQYFPRLHCIARMLDSDISPIADYVQYVRKHVYPNRENEPSCGPSYQAHTPIKTRNGVVLLSVPILHAGKPQRINEARISYESQWNKKHLNIIAEHYRTAPRFEELFPQLNILLMRRYVSLAELSIATLAWSMAKIFDMKEDRLEDVCAALPQQGVRLRKLMRISETPVMPPDKAAGRDANEWIIDMCKYFGAYEYHFGGTSAETYMDFSRFEAAGIRLKQQNWACTPYRQQFPKKGFIPNLSIIDLVMNVKSEEARAVLHTTAALS